VGFSSWLKSSFFELLMLPSRCSIYTDSSFLQPPGFIIVARGSQDAGLFWAKRLAERAVLPGGRAGPRRQRMAAKW
jgi:hypothetical protein